MYKDIEQYTQICKECNKVKSKPYIINGHRYILSIIDRFSRYCMLIPLRNIKAITVVKGFERWMSQFAFPKCILSDEGNQFISRVFALLTKQYGIKKKFTTIYHHQCNAVVERLHRWIKERLVLIALNHNQSQRAKINTRWDDYATEKCNMKNHLENEQNYKAAGCEVKMFEIKEDIDKMEKYIQLQQRNINAIQSNVAKLRNVSNNINNGNLFVPIHVRYVTICAFRSVKEGLLEFELQLINKMRENEQPKHGSCVGKGPKHSMTAKKPSDMFALNYKNGNVIGNLKIRSHFKVQ